MEDSDSLREQQDADPVHDIRRELDKALREKEELAKENRVLKDKEEEYYNQTGEAQQERDDLQKQLSNVESEKVQIGRKLAQLVEFHDKAARENTALKAAEEKLKDVLESQRTERETIDLQLKASQRQVKDLRQDMTDLRKELKQAQGRVDDRNVVAESLRSNLDEATEKIAELEKQVEAGEAAQDSLQELQQGLEDTFENLGKGVAIDEYLMHIRNLQHQRPRRDASEASLERNAVSEKARLTPKRQLSMADELNGFDTDDDEEPEDSFISYELIAPPARHSIHLDDNDETPRKFDTHVPAIVRSDSPSHSPSRPSRLRYAETVEDEPEMNGKHEDAQSVAHDDTQSTDDEEILGPHKPRRESSYTTSPPRTNGLPKPPPPKLDFSDEENQSDIDLEDAQLELSKFQEKFDVLFKQLQDAQETNQHLEEQVAKELNERDYEVELEKAEVEKPVYDNPPVKVPRSTINPWIYTFVATLFAIYFAFALHQERSYAFWANDSGPYSARRTQAPGPFLQAIENIIGFDRTPLG